MPIETKLKNKFKQTDYVSTTANIWNAHKRFLGMTAHRVKSWILKHGKDAYHAKVSGGVTYRALSEGRVNTSNILWS